MYGLLLLVRDMQLVRLQEMQERRMHPSPTTEEQQLLKCVAVVSMILHRRTEDDPTIETQFVNLQRLLVYMMV